MRNFFYYVFYKSSKFYEDWGEKDGYILGRMVICGSISFQILSIIIFVLYYFLNEKINEDIIVGVITTGTIISSFIKEKKYKELVKRYKNEKNSILKGWLVFAYLISSIILYLISMILCGYWVHIKL